MLLAILIFFVIIAAFILYMENAAKNNCCYEFCHADAKCRNMPPKYLVDRYAFDRFAIIFQLYFNEII